MNKSKSKLQSSESLSGSMKNTNQSIGNKQSSSESLKNITKASGTSESALNSKSAVSHPQELDFNQDIQNVVANSLEELKKSASGKFSSMKSIIQFARKQSLKSRPVDYESSDDSSSITSTIHHAANSKTKSTSHTHLLEKQLAAAQVQKSLNSLKSEKSIKQKSTSLQQLNPETSISPTMQMANDKNDKVTSEIAVDKQIDNAQVELVKKDSVASMEIIRSTLGEACVPFQDEEEDENPSENIPSDQLEIIKPESESKETPLIKKLSARDMPAGFDVESYAFEQVIGISKDEQKSSVTGTSEDVKKIAQISEDLKNADNSIGQISEDFKIADNSIENQTPEDLKIADNSINQTPEDFKIADNSIENQTTEDVKIADNSINQTPEDFKIADNSIENQITEDVKIADNSIENQTPEDLKIADNSIENQTTEDVKIADNSIQNQTPEDLKIADNSIENQTPEDLKIADNSIENQTPEDLKIADNSIENQTPEDVKIADNSIENQTPEDVEIADNSIENQTQQKDEVTDDQHSTKNPSIEQLNEEKNVIQHNNVITDDEINTINPKSNEHLHISDEKNNSANSNNESSVEKESNIDEKNSEEALQRQVDLLLANIFSETEKEFFDSNSDKGSFYKMALEDNQYDPFKSNDYKSDFNHLPVANGNENGQKNSPKKSATQKDSIKNQLAAKPQLERPKTAKPQSARPETAKPQLDRPQTAKTQSSRPDTAKKQKLPNTTKPKLALPESAKTQLERPKTAKPQLDRPQTAKTQSSRPETAKQQERPKTAKPKSARPESKDIVTKISKNEKIIDATTSVKDQGGIPEILKKNSKIKAEKAIEPKNESTTNDRQKDYVKIVTALRQNIDSLKIGVYERDEAIDKLKERDQKWKEALGVLETEKKEFASKNTRLLLERQKKEYQLQVGIMKRRLNYLKYNRTNISPIVEARQNPYFVRSIFDKAQETLVTKLASKTSDFFVFNPPIDINSLYSDQALKNPKKLSLSASQEIRKMSQILEQPNIQSLEQLKIQSLEQEKVQNMEKQKIQSFERPKTSHGSRLEINELKHESNHVLDKNKVPTSNVDDFKPEVGARVCIMINEERCLGVLLFLGPLENSSIEEIWGGVALDRPLGNHNGTFKEVRYFECNVAHGIFVKLDRILPANIRSSRVVSRSQSAYTNSMASVSLLNRSLHSSHKIVG